MGNHFVVLLSEKDSLSLDELQSYVNQWREMLLEFDKNITAHDAVSHEDLIELNGHYTRIYERISEEYVYKDFTGSRRMRTPTQESCNTMVTEIEEIKHLLGTFLLRFSDGDSLLFQDNISKMNSLIQKWTDIAIELYSRHRTIKGDKFPQHEIMTTIYEIVLELHNQLQLQVTGENGVTALIVTMQNEINTWQMRLEKTNPQNVSESDWLKWYDKLEDWGHQCNAVRDCLGSIRGLENSQKDIKIDDSEKLVTSWLQDTLTGIAYIDTGGHAEMDDIGTSIACSR